VGTLPDGRHYKVRRGKRGAWPRGTLVSALQPRARPHWLDRLGRVLRLSHLLLCHPPRLALPASHPPTHHPPTHPPNPPTFPPTHPTPPPNPPQNYHLVHTPSGARRLMVVAEDGVRKDRRYAYKAAPDLGGCAV
jgi:hypothetical protein